MSQRNDNDTGMAVAFGFVIAGMMAIAIFIAAVATFLAFILTILAIVAWNNPLHLGKHTIEPQEARAFVYRGLFGAFIVPIFIAFCDAAFDLVINWNYWSFFVVGGYVGGSIGIEALMAEDNKPEVSVYTPPANALPAPRRNPKPEEPAARPAQPFRYASWDDEEELR